MNRSEGGAGAVLAEDQIGVIDRAITCPAAT
jgi:hypothetical protein